MSLTLAIAVPCIFILAGLVLIYGAWRRWPFLVSPPEYLWPIYSQAFIKKHFGPSAVIYATYVMGAVIVLVALGLLINVLIVTQS